VLTNKNNHDQWPQVVSDDVLKHVYLLKNRVHVLAGQVKGKTLLPLPAGRQFNTCLDTGDMYVSFICFTVEDCGSTRYPRVNPTRPVTRGSGRVVIVTGRVW